MDLDKKEYSAYVVTEKSKQKFVGKIETRKIEDLPRGDVLIKVHYSSLNYKDALSATGNRGVTKRYPHTPGIDAAGVVVESTNSNFKAGDKVIASCFDLGMNHPGGFAEYIRVPSTWVTHLPDGLTLKESMILGTAGFTAGRCVDFLISQGVKPENGKILVTGATGGVGSVAVAVLSKLGFRVTAVTGKDESDFLSRLGATEILPRHELEVKNGKMLLKETWAGVVDTVGGVYLETAIKQTQYDGIVTSCGNAASADLNISVYPFIIRGVRLIGVDSAKCGGEPREKVWQHLANEWKINFLEDLAQMITLNQLEESVEKMLAGKLRGRTVVSLI